jgi:hypothetical protein
MVLGPSTNTRVAGSSNDSSPLSPFSAGNSHSFGIAAVHRRKHSNNAEDNRRVAIVPLEVDLTLNCPGPVPGDETGGQYLPSSAPHIATTTLPLPPLPLAGQGLDTQLAGSGSALVAPPDTNLFSLHDVPLSSPTTSSSPPTSPTTPNSKKRPSFPSAQPAKSRSARAVSHSKSSSRDIGIVGTRRDLHPPELFAAALSQGTSSDYRPPIFQTPTLRSASPPVLTPIADTAPGELDTSVQSASLPCTAHARPAAMCASVEPILGVSPAVNGHGGHAQPHSIHSLTADQRQSSPSSLSTTSTAPSSYLFYQPGVHSTAGPLPPPPRAMFDIDFNAPPPPRPPRLRSPSPLNTKKGAGGSTTPASVTVKLASKASIPSIHQVHVTTTPPERTGSSSGSSAYSE